MIRRRAELGRCGLWLRRLPLRLHDQPAARATEPDIAVVPPTIKITAALVLSDEGHQGVEDCRHGAGRLSQR